MLRLVTRFLSVSLLLISVSVAASVRADDLAWPKVTNETKPWSRWWWLGSIVTEDGLRSEMEKYAAAGLGGLEITPIYGVHGKEDQFIQYLSPKWVDRFEFVLGQGKRLGLGIDMATGTGWPFGGPWVTPEDTCKYLASKTFTVKAGEKLSEPVTMVERFMVAPRSVTLAQLKEPFGDTPNLQQLAIDNLKMPSPLKLNLLMAFSDAGKEPLNLTDKVAADGTLNWTAPADSGTWTLYAVFDGLHSRMVKRAAPGGEGHVPDHLSSEAIQHYLAKFDQALAGKSLDGFRSYFSDSYEVDNGTSGEANFTPHFFEEFQKRRGYDLRPLLPVLLGTKSGGDQYTRILCDYRETVSDLLLDGFTKTWQQWAGAKDKLVRNQAHGSPANLLDLYAAVDIPETEGFGNPGNPDTELTEVVEMMYASSGAHLTGKRLASSETCTWLDDHFLTTLAHAKQRIDATFLGGINHIFYHGTPYSPPGAPWPGYLFYAAVEFCPANSWWDDFAALNKYVERCQSFLQAGHPDNDLLVYVPIHDDWMKPGNGTMPHYAVGGRWPAQGIGREVLKAGYTFDFVSDRLLKDVTFADGKLHCGGNSYQMILLPETKFLPLETLKKLVDLSRQGATIAVQKELPADVPRLADLEARRAKLKELLAALRKDEKSEGGITEIPSGAGRLVIGSDLDILLARPGNRREVLASRGIGYIRRRDGENTIYYLVNQSDRPLDDRIALAPRPPAQHLAIFDPMTGRIGRVPSVRTHDDGSIIHLQLPVGQSCIVVASPKELKGPEWTYFRARGTPEPLGGAWNISFTKGGPKLPAPVDIGKLQSWTEFAGEDGKAFSGTAKYTLKFAKPTVASDVFRLDLGKVADSARVSLNGEELGVLFSSPFALDIPADQLKDQNTLEILVSNLMANRIADMDRRNVQWKIFYNANVAAHDAANRGPGNVFSAANWKPRESGLIGPVTLTPLEKFDPLKGQ